MRLNEISKRHGTYYYSKDEKLPDDMVKLFTDLAHDQRMGVENTMLGIQKAHPYGHFIRSHIEHLGDLIHGFAESAKFNGIVRDLDRKVHAAQESFGPLLSGNIDEFKVQVTSYSNKTGIPEQELYTSFAQDLEKYVIGHMKLPAYNDIHLLCKKITTSLGGLAFTELSGHLDEMASYFEEGEDQLLKRAWTITRDRNGNIVQIG